MQQMGFVKTLYEDREKKGIKVQFNPTAASEIEAYMQGLEGMLEAYKDHPEIFQGLQEIKIKAKTLLISQTPETEIIEGIRKMTTIAGPNGEKINIAHFSKAKSQQIQDETLFKERTLKRLHQTTKNIFALRKWQPNEELSQLAKQLKAIDSSLPSAELEKAVREVLHSESFNTYQTVKNEYIKGWLKPFQKFLDKPVHALSQAEIQDAMKRMKIVINQSLNEGNLVVFPDADKLAEFNVKNHDLVNGDNQIFWLNNLLMDEFITFTESVLSRFTFMLDKQFLIFRFKSEPYLYLIGFSNESFLKAEQADNGSLVISPHVKPIIQGKDKVYREMIQSNFPSVGMYIDVLKDTLKPFFMALAEKIEFEFSKEFKDHFKM